MSATKNDTSFAALLILEDHLEACPKCKSTITRDLTFDWLCPDGRKLAIAVVRATLDGEKRRGPQHAPRTRATVAATRALIDAVCRKHGVTPASIQGKSKQPRIRAARREAIAQVASLGFAQRDVGRFFRRGHSSVESAVKAFGPVSR